MKQTLLWAALLAACSGSALCAEQDVGLSQGSRGGICCKRRTCKPTPISKPVTITKSGCYCLTNDIFGVITIAADHVEVDLNCHVVNAKGADHAIIIEDVQDVTVFNGAVTNSAVAGIIVDTCTSVKLRDLFVFAHGFESIRVEDSTDVDLSDIDFQGDEAERALTFDTCSNISVKRCNISGFLSTTLGPIVQVLSCNCGLVEEVNICNNTKTVVADPFELSVIVLIDSCSGIDFVRLKVNNNLANTESFFSFLSLLVLEFSNNCTFHQCQTSNNRDESVQPDVGIIFAIEFCDNITLTEHQANNNQWINPALQMRVINTFDSNNLVFDNCQVNNNVVAELIIDPDFLSEFIGIKIQQSFFGFDEQENIVIRNCQVNDNRIDDGGAGRTFGDPPGLMLGIVLEGSFVDFFGGQAGFIVEGIQVNNNTMGNSPENTLVIGIAADTATNIAIRNSLIEAQKGGQFAAGIQFFIAFDDSPVDNQTVTNCSISNNGDYGVLIGDPTFTAPLAFNNIAIIDSVIHQNGRENTAFDSAGIAFKAPANNVLIKGCQLYDNFAGGGAPAAGISAIGTTNLVIEDTNVFNTRATGSTGHGILLDNVTNAKVLRSQVHTNQDNGVQIEGENDTICVIETIAKSNQVGVNFAQGSSSLCSLVQDSRALNNAVAGFVHAPDPLNTTFIGNEAQCNGASAADNYVITGGLINLQELSWATGVIANVNGGAALGSRFTNLRAVG